MGEPPQNLVGEEFTGPMPKVGPYPISGLVRRARRLADLSQREMAKRAKVAASTIGKVEAGALTPSVDVLQRLLATAGLWLVVVDPAGRVIEPMADRDDLRDHADRRYPSHLDTILDPAPGQWWGDLYGLTSPPETFYRDRDSRDIRRAYSRWQRYYEGPEPMRPETFERLRARTWPAEVNLDDMPEPDYFRTIDDIELLDDIDAD